eukprot:COSAG01_NODE_3567_length_5925_cov_14.275318_1_plen_198_part_00
MSWDQTQRKWKAQINVGGKRHYLGMFGNESDAARQCKEAQAAQTAGRPLPARPEVKSTSTSKHNGVCWVQNARKWRAVINVGGKRHYLGMFGNESDAARQCKEAEEARDSGRPLPARPEVKATSTSKHNGVCWVQNARKWRAHITIDGKRHLLGLFSNESDAARQRKKAEEARDSGQPLPPARKKRSRTSQHKGVGR